MIRNIEDLTRLTVLLAAMGIIMMLSAAAGEPQNFDGDFSRIVAAIKSGDRSPLDFSRPIAPGVTHRFQYIPDKPWMINIIEIKFDKPPTPDAPIQVMAEAGADRLYQGERTSKMAHREAQEGRPVICAINADFYAENHRPVGLFVDDGHIFKNPYSVRPVFAVGQSGKFYITETTLSVLINIGEKEFMLEDVNPTASGGNGAVFTPKNNRPIPFNAEFAWFRLKPRGQTFLPNDTALFDFAGPLDVAADFNMKDDEFVIAAIKDKELAAALDGLAPQSTIRIYPKIPEIPESITMAVGGIPRLITDGKIDVAWEKAKISESFSTTEHPRTAVGFSQDGLTLWLVTVDGRQSGLSRGISLDDLAALMRELGCWQAVNLDGGGSTTMLVRDQIINSPSDLRGERVVSNSVMVVMNPQKAGPSRMVKPVIYPQNVLLPANSACQFRAEWVDEYMNPVAKAPAMAKFKVEGAVGTIDASGILQTAGHAGKGQVSVFIEGDVVPPASTSIEVAEIKSITFHPHQMLLRKGEEQSFGFSVNASDGRRFFLDEGTVAITYPPIIRPVPGKQSVVAETSGRGEISVTIGGVKAAVPVAVDQFEQKIVQSFDTLPEPPKDTALVTGRQYKEDMTKIAIVADPKQEGAGALKWEYGMKSGGTTTIYLNSEVPLPGEPKRLGIWVRGDGKGTWLRGVLRDKDGERFLIDWSGSGGIFWSDDWKFLEFNLEDLTPYFDSPRGIPNPPYTLTAIYLAQQQEAAKADSAIVIDALTAVYGPSN